MNSESPKKKYRPAGVILTVLFMLLFLGALGLRIWASAKSTETVGPDHIAVGQDRVYVHVNGELFVLSAQGEIHERKNIEPLVQDTSLIDMRVLQDGRLLLAKQRPAGIEVCDTRHWRCEPLGRVVTTKINSQFKAWVDEASGSLFVSDVDSFKVWIKPRANSEPQPLTTKSNFRRPNDVAMDANGRLWIADSGNHRIVAFERKSDGTWEEARSHDTRNRSTREERDWPMMLALAPDGNWWVTQSTARGSDADVLVYHPESGAQSRIELPPDAYPTDIARLGATMLVTDMEKFRIHQIDATTHALSEFGGVAFQETMKQAAERKARYLAIVDQSLIGMIAFGALMIFAAFWASPKERRWTVPATTAPLGASNTPAPNLREIHWLRRHPKTERMLRWMKPLSYVIPIVMIANVGYLYCLFGSCADTSVMTPDKAGKLEEVEMMLLVITFFTAGIPILANAAMRSLQHRLGTDGYRLFVKLADGRQVSLAPEQLVYSARHIAYRAYVFPVQTGKGQPLYDEGEVTTYIAPLLSRAKKLGPWEMFRYQLKNHEPTLMISLIYIVMLTAMMLATGMWRRILPSLS